ncbi:hypothetical protein KIH39_06125 [Telmatocola sphagniphila]|uniref:Uncharacterized protein n=1 Tax=Telmatocola sphagniphila TaxID=1123043 RepID=A0A8E6BAN3_9BACT|nr:hypothetical protein [Telmatocola sphagniphila]QVL33485.1 hypothetical protein KIH39_06125 [Telmatocola sphagniphila]
METEELKSLWNELGNLSTKVASLDGKIVEVQNRPKLSQYISRFNALLILELAMDLVAVLFTGSFLFTHLHEPKFLIPGLFLHLSVILLIAQRIRLIIKTKKLDFSAPVLWVQKHLSEIRALRVTIHRWILILSPLIWIPFAIVATQGALGIDLYKEFDPAWILANLLLGLLILAGSLWVSHRYATYLQESIWFGQIADQLAGRSLKQISKVLTDLESFETESEK